MKKLNTSIAMMCLSALATTTAMAEGVYATAQLGISQQASDSEAYGNNIAADADFPAEFDNDDATVGGVGIGYQFNDNLRMEGRIGYRKSDFHDTQYGTGARNGHDYILDGEIKSTTFTVEGFYDFKNSTAFTPYVKAGIGVSKNKYAARLGGSYVAVDSANDTGGTTFDAFDGTVDGYYDNYADGDATEFSWNLGLGANYAMTPKASVFGEYQYASFGDVQTGQDSFTDGFKVDNTSAHEFQIGMRYQF